MKKLISRTGCMIWAVSLILIPVLATVSIFKEWNMLVSIALWFSVMIDLFVIAALIMIVCGADEEHREE